MATQSNAGAGGPEVSLKAIVLSAGQGRRLLPLTENEPKCMLPVDEHRPVLELQLENLARCGVREATVFVGFGAERVEAFLARNRFGDLRVDTFYNPFYSITDNLITCWLARAAMTDDFLLLNGDTLFEEDLLRRVLTARAAPVTVTIDRKEAYDDDDMKVSLDGAGRLSAIGKTLAPETVHGESIGMLLFRGPGVAAFRGALENSIRKPEALKLWYLSVVNDLARRITVNTASIEGLWWQEIDAPDDLADARAFYLEQRSKTTTPVGLVASNRY
jgi:choline kinase